MIVDAEQIYEPLFKRETNQFQNNSLSQKVSVNFADRLLPLTKVYNLKLFHL